MVMIYMLKQGTYVGNGILICQEWLSFNQQFNLLCMENILSNLEN